MHIDCPHCGPREESEFQFDRAFEGVVDPRNAATAVELYPRTNPRGWTEELWQHAGGCRAWLRVERHTLTHDIRTIKAARQ